MDFSFRHDFWQRALSKSPLDRGLVHRLVVRPAESSPGGRLTPEEILVEPGVGVVGDRWDPAVDQPGSEVSLMNVHALRSVAGGEDRMALSGDNLQVDLDLSQANLPVGTRLLIGDAILEISDALHRPCASFHERYGKSGAQKVARANRTGHRGRGVLCLVAQAGTIRVGDAIEVQRPQ